MIVKNTDFIAKSNPRFVQIIPVPVPICPLIFFPLL